MAYREYGMWEILDVLRRHGRGESLKQITRVTGRSRNTVRRYVSRARSLGWEAGKEEPTEELAARVLEGLRPRPERSPEETTEGKLLDHLAQIQLWLAGNETHRPLRLTKIHELLTRRGVIVPYSSLHRFAVKHASFGKRRSTVRMADSRPGELAEVDFGRLGLVPTHARTGRRTLWALIVTLCFSRHQFVYPTFHQTLEVFIDGIEAAWEFFGGVVERLVVDNLKAAVLRADRYEPIFQRTFDEYADHRGFIIDAAVPRHATGKPKVERAVPYVRDRFFAGETFSDDLREIRERASTWCLTVAGTRRHGTTGKAPLALFEAEERAMLRPITTLRFDTPNWAECVVARDHHISFRKAIYSVPHPYVGKKVTVRGDRALVRIYRSGKLIKTHEPQPPSGRSTDYHDYPPETSAYARRDPEWMIGEAKKLGEHTGRFAERLLGGPVPWSRLRQAQKLMRLAQRYGAGRVDAACQRALAFDLVNVRRVEEIIKNGLTLEATSSPPRAPEVLPLPLTFAREPEHFAPRRGEEDPDGD